MGVVIMNKDKKQQISFKQVQSAYEKLLKLRNDTGKCAEDIIGLLKANAFIDQEKADSMLNCVYEMTAVQEQICAFLKQNSLSYKQTVTSVHNAITEYEKKRDELAKKQAITK